MHSFLMAWTSCIFHGQLREPSSRSVQVAAREKKGLHWIAFMTCHSLPPRSYPHRLPPARILAQDRPSPMPRVAGTVSALSRPLAPLCEWLRVIRITRVRRPRAVAGQRDWSRRVSGFSHCTACMLHFVLFVYLSPTMTPSPHSSHATGSSNAPMIHPPHFHTIRPL